MNDIDYQVRRADWDRDQESLGQVRVRVFVEEQGVPLNMEWDGLDENALHLLAEDPAGRAIGVARMLADGHIGRMAVLPQWRRKGVGSALLLELLRRRMSGSAVFLNAQTSALGFYHRFGFTAQGPEFMDAGIPHRRMILGSRK